MSPRLFISYRRSQSARIDALVIALKAVGIEVWRDRAEIDTADSIQRRIDEGLARCHALLAWYCVDYPNSRACQWELTAAWIAASAETQPVKRILVFNPEQSSAHIQPLQVRDLQHLDANCDDTALAHRILELIQPIQGELGALRRLSRPSAYGYTPLSSSRFVGRVNRLWEIHSALAAGNFAIVAGRPSSGLATDLVQVPGSGGIGKSLLVEEYVLRFGACWPGGVFWLRAYGNSDRPEDTAEALSQRRDAAFGSQLVSFCQHLGIDTREKDHAQLRAELGRTLTAPYLWIVDDLPDLARTELEPWLAPSAAGRTLVTTRSRRLDGLGTSVDLGLLEINDARALLTGGALLALEQQPAVERILQLLDGHALAIDIARAACLRLGYSAFLRQLESPDHDAMALAAGIAKDTLNGHSPYIAVTLLGSVQHLDAHGTDSLRIASGLAAAPIADELVAACLVQADGLEEAAAEARAALGVQQLLNHSLAEPTGLSQFSIHTLIARTLRFCDAPGTARRAQLEAAAVQVLVQRMALAADIRRHADLQLILPHVQWLARRLDDPRRLALAGWLGRRASEAGHYRDAERWCRAEREARIALQGEDHEGTLRACHNLAIVLSSLGEYQEARALDEQVLKWRRRELGEAHQDTLASASNLANLLQRAGNIAEGLALREATFEIAHRELGDEHRLTLVSMENLGSLLVEQGDHDRGRQLQEQALSIRCRVLGNDHPETLTSMSNLAATLHRQGDAVEARALLEQTLEIRLLQLGHEHEATNLSAWHLSLSLIDAGDVQSAHELRRKHLQWLLTRDPQLLSSQQQRIRAWLLDEHNEAQT